VAMPTMIGLVIVVAVTVAAEEVLERSRAHPMSRRVAHAVGDHEKIARVLVEQLVGLSVQRVGRGVPNHLIDADNPAAAATVEVAQADEEHGAAAHAGDVDRPRERDREAWLQIEAIELVEQIDVLTVGGVNSTVRLRKVDSKSGVLARIGNGKAIRGEGSSGRVGKIEQWSDACCGSRRSV